MKRSMGGHSFWRRRKGGGSRSGGKRKGLKTGRKK